MKHLPEKLYKKLLQRKEDNSLRVLSEKDSTIIDFSSNDYLGFAECDKIYYAAHNYLEQNNMVFNGATGSRLISGNHMLYKETEDYLAHFHEVESAIIFNSGYDANLGFFSSIPQKGDVVLYDEYIHASVRDGLRLSNGKAFKFRHNDIKDLQKLIEKFRSDNNEVYIVTESVFSMDGDIPDLKGIVTLCEQYDCRLIVDEAHALGVFGENGEGLLQELLLHKTVFARIVTFGKALGCHGAAILGNRELRKYLVNFSRSFIYTTALPPHSLATIIMAYRQLPESKEIIKKLLNNIDYFNSCIINLGLQRYFIKSTSAIHCAIVPGNQHVRFVAQQLFEEGFGVKAILSPAVPENHERLRFCLHSNTTHESIHKVLASFKEHLQPFSL